jgi:molecular chaperone DnaJ
MNMLLLLLLLIVVVQTESNPYQMLGVSRDANDQQIRKAFKELSLKYHPDLAVTHDERYAQIINAYELLKDP